ncbi:ATP-dependent DNA helicase PIF7, partial [Biomphalaria glabrata]|nr:ATP-dependent DNA helicase PIF7-like [Biomphalaria glabrata]
MSLTWKAFRGTANEISHSLSCGTDLRFILRMAPRKRKSSESMSPAAIKKRKQREKETVEKKEARLTKQRHRTAQKRANETEEQRKHRLNQNSQRNRDSRAEETSEQTENRRQADRQNVAKKRKERKLKKGHLYLAGFKYVSSANYPPDSAGEMNEVCVHCQAFRFKNEIKGICCLNGQIQLPSIDDPPEPFYSYLLGENKHYKKIITNILTYNSCFQFTSSLTQNQTLPKIGSILPKKKTDSKNLQIYFMSDDENVEAQKRCANVQGIETDILLDLQRILQRDNQIVKLLKTALEKMPSDDYKIILPPDSTISSYEKQKEKQFPTIADSRISNTQEDSCKGALVIPKRSLDMKTVPRFHRSYDALQYPLIFWQGEDGYHFKWKKINSKTKKSTKMSSREFYAYHIMKRTSNHILKLGQLFNHFIVDMFTKIENERISYFKSKKKKRTVSFCSLKDAVEKNKSFREIGKESQLPSSFTGGPSYWFEAAQDILAYKKYFGIPDLFITFKCNSDWQEIQVQLFTGQTSKDRPDLIARVFKQKLFNLMKLITRSEIFGEIQCWNYFVKFKKNGLPEAKMLVWLNEKLMQSQIDIDQVISAELPDPNNDRKLYDVVVNHMVHGPCGDYNKRAPCMKKGECTKAYPKEFLQTTHISDTFSISYRRRSPQDEGLTTHRKVGKKGKDFKIDNTWIVPYSPLLCKMFETHVNVEICDLEKLQLYIGQLCIKYRILSDDRDDDQCQTERSITSSEAVWRILNFPLRENFPPVFSLDVHLQDQQSVYFTEDNFVQLATQPENTKLTAFFQLCEADQIAETLLYPEVSKYYTWTKKKYHRRKRGTRDTIKNVYSQETLARICAVHPSDSERYHLRLLLYEVPGPKSFDALKTVGGQKCETYKEACEKRGLIIREETWETTLQEAIEYSTAEQLRSLFSIILSFSKPSNPKSLWDKFKGNFSKDIKNRRKEEKFIEALKQIENKCMLMNGKTIKDLNINSQTGSHESGAQDYEYNREMNYDITKLRESFKKDKPRLRKKQRSVFTAIQKQITSGGGGLFFLDAPGGTGKTFLLNMLLTKIRMQKKIALALASTGLAASLLDGGRTAHSALKLPLDIATSIHPKCNISNNSGIARVLKECVLIVWDECTMAHKKSLEALNTILNEIRGSDTLMGGAVVVFSGDFRQTLPVIPGSTVSQQLNACIKSSYLWNKGLKVTLKKNMRVQNNKQFSKHLLRIGNGKYKTISFPWQFCHWEQSYEGLIKKVYPDILENFKSSEWLCERAILAPTNQCVDRLNVLIQDKLPGAITTYKSLDTVVNSEESELYPEEFLNTLELPGLPSHILQLKIGSAILLMRNIDPPNLCNGTKLSVKALFPNIIQATALNGKATGKD